MCLLLFTAKRRVFLVKAQINFDVIHYFYSPLDRLSCSVSWYNYRSGGLVDINIKIRLFFAIKIGLTGANSLLYG